VSFSTSKTGMMATLSMERRAKALRKRLRQITVGCSAIQGSCRLLTTTPSGAVRSKKYTIIYNPCQLTLALALFWPSFLRVGSPHFLCESVHHSLCFKIGLLVPPSRELLHIAPLLRMDPPFLSHSSISLGLLYLLLFLLMTPLPLPPNVEGPTGHCPSLCDLTDPDRTHELLGRRWRLWNDR